MTRKRFNWSHEEASAYIASGSLGGCYRPAPLGDYTYVIRDEDDGSVALRYHITDLVTWRVDGSVVLDTRPGHGVTRWGERTRTQTVLKRINTYAPVVVREAFEGNEWMVDMAGDDCVFEDGFAIGPDYQLSSEVNL